MEILGDLLELRRGSNILGDKDLLLSVSIPVFHLHCAIMGCWNTHHHRVGNQNVSFRFDLGSL